MKFLGFKIFWYYILHKFTIRRSIWIKTDNILQCITLYYNVGFCFVLRHYELLRRKIYISDFYGKPYYATRYVIPQQGYK